MKINNLLLLIICIFCYEKSYSMCSEKFCDVNNFQGNIDERIKSAITESANTKHKIVYFPDGEYFLTKPITLDNKNTNITLKGESIDGTKIYSSPIKIYNYCLGPIFNFDTPGGFNNFFVSIKNFTLDFSLAINDNIFTSGGCSQSGHGVRVGNGWKNGRLTLDRLKILNPPGYGIGVQNHSAGGISANNVIITNVYIENSGQDALDTKRAHDGGNSNLTIIDMKVREIGLNDGGSSAGLDISYDNFYVKRLSIITEPNRVNPKGISENIGIRLRQREQGSASNGTIRDFYIKGTHHGIFFEGKRQKPNSNITLKNFRIKNFTGTGIYVRGQNHEIRVGCSYTGVGHRSWYVSPEDSVLDSIYMNISMHSGDHCPSYNTIGSNF